MKKLRFAGIAAGAAAIALIAAGCGNGAANDGASAAPGANGDTVELTWWHNNPNEPQLGLWQSMADAFTEANPNVHITVTAVQNEDLRNTVLPNAMAAGQQPDIFQSWGGGELRDWHSQGLVRSLDGVGDDAINAAGSAIGGWQIDGTTYGVPYTFGPSGFWVNMDVWNEAGLTDFPTTLEDLMSAWEQIAANTDAAPVALGGGSTWPVGHWWYWTAVKSVPVEVLEANLSGNFDFSDQGWVDAGTTLQTIRDANPFNDGWQTTEAQTGAASASGRVVLGQAAMQLMGLWDAGVMGSVYNESNGHDAGAPLPDGLLGWFPFPAIDGANGDPTALLGGGDGFSVSANAPDEAVEFLNFIMNAENQTAFAVASTNLPTNADADTSSLPETVQQAGEAMANAGFVALWFDAAFGSAVGDAMNGAIVAFMNGSGTPQDIVTAMQNAAG